MGYKEYQKILAGQDQYQDKTDQKDPEVIVDNQKSLRIAIC